MNKENIRQLLRSLGFTRVDGLTIFIRIDGLKIIPSNVVSQQLAEKSIVPVIIPRGKGGRVRMGSDNNFTGVETPDGEIWIGKPSLKQANQLVNELCHMDIARMENVPCSNGESLDFNDLMSRDANPDFIPKYE